MKKSLTLLLAPLLISAFSTFAQTLPPFLPIEQTPCPFDPASTIEQPLGWLFYQTVDGQWNGPVDSSRCLSVQYVPATGGLDLELGQINPERPLFVRARLDLFPSNEILLFNFLYNIYAYAVVRPANVPVLSGAGCTEDLCTGVIVGIAIPDTAGNPGGATRIQTGIAAKSTGATKTGLETQSCFPTEYFVDQSLLEFILKFTFDSVAILDGSNLEIRLPNIEQAPGDQTQVGYITEVPAYINPINVEQVSNPGFVQFFMGLYDAPTYPDPQHLSYIEAVPVPNVTTPQDITLTVLPFQVLEMQPFTQFRGGLVAGSDSVRHTFTLLNDGGDICLNFVDLIFNGGDAYQHGGGSLEFNNPYSCMQFKNGGQLRIESGQTLHYGNEGAGMLQLCAGGTIVLERDATLIVDAILQMSECNDELPPSEIYMDLLPGSNLVFTDNAWVTNRYSKQQKMHLNVHMLGGTLDDSALDAGSRTLIRRIYPEPSPRLANNIRFAPNPFAGNLDLEYLAASEERLQLRWFDVQGRLCGTELFFASKGWNQWKPVAPTSPGFYFAEVQTEHGRHVQRLIRVQE